MLETIINHKSIRKFKNKSIDKEILDKILYAGTRASTTGNMQVYSIIVTTDESLKNELWEYHFKQDMVKDAPVVMTFCADYNRFNKWCEQRNAEPGYNNFLSFYNGTIDALLVAQNVCIAAESFGLGICYLGTTAYMAAPIAKTLNLPEDVMPVTTIVMGYPDETPELTDRLPIDAVVHYETYKDFTANDIDIIYKERENSDFTKELIKINKTENLAQIFTQKRYTKKDNEMFSEKFKEFLKSQWLSK